MIPVVLSEARDYCEKYTDDFYAEQEHHIWWIVLVLSVLNDDIEWHDEW